MDGTIRSLYPLDLIQLGRPDPVEEVAPALRLLRRLDALYEDEAGTKLFEDAYPVGAVEDEVTVLVRGDYYGVALLPFGFHALSQTGQAVFVVGFMEDEAIEV